MLRLKSTKTGSEHPSSIDMTPMIDMVFQLLIFFLLTSIFASQTVLDLTLPSAEQATKSGPNKKIDILIRKEGTILIDLQMVSLERLQAALQEKSANDSKIPVVLSADQEAPFQRFVDVLDAVRALGLSNLAIVTRPEEHPP